MPTEITEISFASLVFIPSICAGRAVPSHLCFLMAVLNKPGYFKLFLWEVFLISPTTWTGFFHTVHWSWAQMVVSSSSTFLILRVFLVTPWSSSCVDDAWQLCIFTFRDCMAFLVLLWCKCLCKLLRHLLYYPTWLDFYYFSASQHILLFKFFLLTRL